MHPPLTSATSLGSGVDDGASFATMPPSPAATHTPESASRTWHGDVSDLPYFFGPFDAIFFNACFGNMFDQRAALIKALSLMRPGSCLVLSHPLGRTWVNELHAADPARVPHPYPVGRPSVLGPSPSFRCEKVGGLTPTGAAPLTSL